MNKLTRRKQMIKTRIDDLPLSISWLKLKKRNKKPLARLKIKRGGERRIGGVKHRRRSSNAPSIRKSLAVTSI